MRLDECIAGSGGDVRPDAPGNGSSAQAQPKGKPVTFLHDVLLSAGTEFTVLVCAVLLISLFGRLLGAKELSEYLLQRRITAWLLTGSCIGLSTGLPRYVALVAPKRPKDCASYFLAGFACMMFVALVVGGILVAARERFAGLLFGDSHDGALVVALALMMVGLAAETAVFSYYRGRLMMVRANLVYGSTIALVPLAIAAVLYWTDSVPLIVAATGGMTLVVSCLFAVPVFGQLSGIRASSLGAHTLELLRYGIPRVPGDFGAAALLAVGPIVAAHYASMSRISSLLLGLSFLMVIGYVSQPLGVVLLSKVSMMLGQNRHDQVRDRLESLLAAVPEISVFACVQLFVFADVIVRLWVGPKFPQDLMVIRLLILAIPPYLFYTALRSTIDAATVKPLNAGNVLTSLAAFFVLMVAAVKLLPAKFLLEGVAGSLVVVYLLLAMLTLRTFHKLYRLKARWRRTAATTLAAVALGGLASGYRQISSLSFHPVHIVLVEVVAGLAYLAILVGMGSAWIHYIWDTGLRPKVDSLWRTINSGGEWV